jgi:hypothetical protein
MAAILVSLAAYIMQVAAPILLPHSPILLRTQMCLRENYTLKYIWVFWGDSLHISSHLVHWNLMWHIFLLKLQIYTQFIQYHWLLIYPEKSKATTRMSWGTNKSTASRASVLHAEFPWQYTTQGYCTKCQHKFGKWIYLAFYSGGSEYTTFQFQAEIIYNLLRKVLNWVY